MKFAILSAVIFFYSFNDVKAQAASYSDPAQAYLRVLLEKGGESNQQQVGTFKVVGTSFLYGGNLIGDVYFKNGSAKNVLITYDTYKQSLGVNAGDDGKALMKQLEELDSFVLKAGPKTEFKTDLKFISILPLDSSKKLFLQRVVTGPRFNLYKAYTSDLGYVSTNYIQSELRQFDLNYTYYYTDNTKPGLKKLKLSS